MQEHPVSENPNADLGWVEAVYQDYCLVGRAGDQWLCRHQRRSRGADRPVVGDRVQFRANPLRGRTQEQAEGQLLRILPRQSTLRRQAPARRKGGETVQYLAANAEQMVILCAARTPPFRAGLVFRLWIAARQAGLSALLCLHKSDSTRPQDRELLVPFAELGLPLIETSIYRSDQLEALTEALRGSFSILMGHSGVGKTSLLRAISAYRGEVGSLSAVQRGRHTTSTARLVPLKNGGRAIDAPGVRTFVPYPFTAREVARHFPFGPDASPGVPSRNGDVAPSPAACRFSDCLHRQENGCAVLQALAERRLRSDTYEHYRRILNETPPA